MVNLRINESYLYGAIVLLIVFTSFWLLTQPHLHSDLLFSGITIDLAILAPLFFFLFVRSRKISPAITVPVFILTLVVLSQVIPSNQQGVLNFIIDYIAPIIELSAISFIGWKIYKSRQYFSSLEAGDFQRKLLLTLKGFTGSPLAAKLASAEISMFYFLLYKWKKSAGFSYHKNSGIIAMVFLIAFLIVVETTIIHLVLVRSYPIIAWILFGLSVYSFFQMISLAKSILLRPIFKDSKALYLHYGWLHATKIPLSEIKQVESCRIEEIGEEFAFFGLIKDTEEKGVCISTEKPIITESLFGQSKQYMKVFIPIDDVEGFLAYSKYES